MFHSDVSTEFCKIKVSLSCPYTWRHRGRKGVTPRILNMEIIRRWVVSFTPRPLYPCRETQYPLDMKLGEPDSRYGSREQEKIFYLCQNSNLDSLLPSHYINQAI
jgi:hypothetical protein